MSDEVRYCCGRRVSRLLVGVTRCPGCGGVVWVSVPKQPRR